MVGVIESGQCSDDVVLAISRSIGVLTTRRRVKGFSACAVSLALLVAAGVTFVMGVPGADDIMLGYQSTSFHDALAMRDLLHRRPAPEFATWLERQGLMDTTHRIRPGSMPNRFRALLPA